MLWPRCGGSWVGARIDGNLGRKADEGDEEMRGDKEAGQCEMIKKHLSLDERFRTLFESIF